IITWTEEQAHVRGGPWFVQHARGATVALASDSARVHFAACKAGMGVAILPCRVADRDSDLVCVLPSERVLSVELWEVVHRDLVRTARVRAVMDMLKELSRGLSDWRTFRRSGHRVADKDMRQSTNPGRIPIPKERNTPWSAGRSIICARCRPGRSPRATSRCRSRAVAPARSVCSISECRRAR